MQRSLLFNLVRHGYGTQIDPTKFKEVYKTQYGKVRIFKIVNIDEGSKRWGANPNNRVCDIDGGWFCRGQYPPALDQFLKVGKDFVQLEDFNKKDEDSEYQKKYFESMKDMQKRKGEMKKEL